MVERWIWRLVSLHFVFLPLHVHIYVLFNTPFDRWSAQSIFLPIFLWHITFSIWELKNVFLRRAMKLPAQRGHWSAESLQSSPEFDVRSYILVVISLCGPYNVSTLCPHVSTSKEMVLVSECVRVCAWLFKRTSVHQPSSPESNGVIVVKSNAHFLS